ncbi:PREDICTED: uncharacterized protein LOC101313751 [Fragaria vesca subsp. vesca]|uniref:uncharacterized protein LOC101313751 n=1 Tax=Fragaria vesca subsp. vesca TaxID=101020 RepID=UPI0002C2F508|nr:PREDICTED: uncharacterized protein LOC101313751 [Fragaria vesca subsp. vesca]
MRSSIWKRPPPGWLSVCLDGAFDPNTMSGGVGIVVRDWHGNFHSGTACSIAHVSSPAHIEAIAGLIACRFVLDHGLSPVKFETESVQLVQAVSSPSRSSDHLQLGQSYEDVADLFMQLPGCSFTRIFREGNEAAQKLALWASASQPCNIYFSSTPPILEEVISADRFYFQSTFLVASSESYDIWLTASVEPNV